MINAPTYKVFEKNVNGKTVNAIEFIDGDYAGLVFSYGKVELIEDDVADELRVKYEYDMHEEPVVLYDTVALEVYLGDFLMTLIAQQLDDKELIYSGGTDAKRPLRDE